MSVESAHTPPGREHFLFHSLTRAYFNAQQAGLNKNGLNHLGSPRILFALMDLSESGRPMPSQRELADFLHISPATIATSLKSLERSGFVFRQPDEQDSRRNLISITEKGRQAILTSRQVFSSVDSYMFHGFSQEEQKMVHELHQRMLENLYQIGGDKDFGNPPPPPPRRKV